MTEQDGNRVGTVKKLGNSYFVRLVEPASEPWHVACSDGPQQVSGWQDDETMTDAEVVGFVPVVECGPSAATQTAEQAQQAVVDDFLGEEATFVTVMKTCPEDKADHHFAMGHVQARRHLAERLAVVGSPVTETTKQDGCCTTCNGKGGMADGEPCSDCLATGHTHDGPCVEATPTHWGREEGGGESAHDGTDPDDCYLCRTAFLADELSRVQDVADRAKAKVDRALGLCDAVDTVTALASHREVAAEFRAALSGVTSETEKR